MTILELLKWRYATKRMTGEKISTEKVEAILEAVRMSASSIGLQPYKLIVVENEELRKQIVPIANNQPQIIECSHLVIFAAWHNLTEERIDAWLQDIQNARGSIAERTQSFATYLKNKVKNETAESNFNWIARQVYIGLGTALIAAAEQKVDATPMEGFDPLALDLFLGLNEKGLRSVLLLPLGVRDTKNDFLLPQVKVRKSKNDFIEWI